MQNAYSFPADFYDHHRFETASWDGRQSIPLSIVRCRRCDLWFSRPSFRADALHLVYPQDLVNPEISFSAALEQSLAKHEALLEILHAHLATGTVCDVGTRYGVLPHLACARGYDAFGIEYNEAYVAIAIAAGAPVIQGSAEHLRRVLDASGRDHIDAFVLDDVIEHLTDPRAVLEALARCQRPGGLLFLRQMDVDSLGHRLFKHRWYYLQPAAHMYYFSERTLRALLTDAHYRVREVRKPFPLRIFARTALRTVPGHLLQRARARNGHAGSKRSYLTRRLRSADDMFLLVAERQ